MFSRISGVNENNENISVLCNIDGAFSSTVLKFQHIQYLQHFIEFACLPLSDIAGLCHSGQSSAFR